MDSDLIANLRKLIIFYFCALLIFGVFCLCIFILQFCFDHFGSRILDLNTHCLNSLLFVSNSDVIGFAVKVLNRLLQTKILLKFEPFLGNWKLLEEMLLLRINNLQTFNLMLYINFVAFILSTWDFVFNFVVGLAKHSHLFSLLISIRLRICCTGSRGHRNQRYVNMIHGFIV